MNTHAAPARPASRGFSLVELVFALGLAATLTAIGLASIADRAEEIRAAGAARSMAALLQRTRAEAVTRNAHVAVKVTAAATTDVLTTYFDGDGDGVLSADIQSGVDQPAAGPLRLADQFPGVRFGVLAGLPAVDPTATPPGSDPIRLGASDMVVFTPLGTATSGTLYLLGRGRQQFAVRVFGETGRTRVLQFNVASGQWHAVGR